MEQALFFTGNFLVEGILSNAGYDLLKNLYGNIRNKKPQQQLPVKPEIPLQPTNTPVYNPAAQRMIDAIGLINDGHSEYNLLSYSHIAELMGMKNGSAFETMLTRKEEVDFEFLNQFATSFNIHAEWLKHGTEGHAFSHAGIHKYRY